MADRKRKLVVLIVGIALSAFAMTADAKVLSSAELDKAWHLYANSSQANTPAFRFPHARCFASAASQYDLPESLLLAVARGESDFEPTARSRANAHGVMQILWPVTANHLGITRLSDLYKPCTNIDAGARYLRELLERYDGNLHLALAAYNYGPGRIARTGKALPKGAVWYSGYIFRHLNFVLGNTRSKPHAEATLYSEVGQSTLLTFGEPYRAIAFIEQLEKQSSILSLDWFRRATGEFEVVMTYADRDEFDAQARQLARSGFRID